MRRRIAVSTESVRIFERSKNRAAEMHEHYPEGLNHYVAVALSDVTAEDLELMARKAGIHRCEIVRQALVEFEMNHPEYGDDEP